MYSNININQLKVTIIITFKIINIKFINLFI